jgi:hypothetical protein
MSVGINEARQQVQFWEIEDHSALVSRACLGARCHDQAIAHHDFTAHNFSARPHVNKRMWTDDKQSTVALRRITRVRTKHLANVLPPQ